jgi:predicted acetyltransferase
MGHPPMNRHTYMRDIAEFVSVVRIGEDGFGQVFPHFIFVDVKGSAKFDVFDMIPS